MVTSTTDIILYCGKGRNELNEDGGELAPPLNTHSHAPGLTCT